MALTVFFGRPSGILLACAGEQRERYLLPAVRGEKFDALAMSEPDAGSDVRGMKCSARPDGDDVQNIDLMIGAGFCRNRSEEHTSELQSLMRISYAVFCLKKKNKQHKQYINIYSQLINKN